MAAYYNIYDYLRNPYGIPQVNPADNEASKEETPMDAVYALFTTLGERAARENIYFEARNGRLNSFEMTGDDSTPQKCLEVSRRCFDSMLSQGIVAQCETKRNSELQEVPTALIPLEAALVIIDGYQKNHLIKMIEERGAITALISKYKKIFETHVNQPLADSLKLSKKSLNINFQTVEDSEIQQLDRQLQERKAAIFVLKAKDAKEEISKLERKLQQKEEEIERLNRRLPAYQEDALNGIKPFHYENARLPTNVDALKAMVNTAKEANVVLKQGVAAMPPSSEPQQLKSLEDDLRLLKMKNQLLEKDIRDDLPQRVKGMQQAELNQASSSKK